MGLQKTSIIADNSFFRHYYLCQYLPLTAGVDALSRSLLKFKRGVHPDLNAWIDCTLEVFKNIPLFPNTIVIRALRHDETQIREMPTTSLDRLCQAITDGFHCKYLPSLLCKSRPTRSNKGLTRTQRQTELDDIYSVSPQALGSLISIDPSRPTSSAEKSNVPITTPAPNPSPPLSFLLIDDILTTGTTARMIIRALRLHFPDSPIQIFTLAKADHDAGLNRSHPLHGRHYRLEENTGWTLAEDPAPYLSRTGSPSASIESPTPSSEIPASAQNSFAELKNSIRTNFN